MCFFSSSCQGSSSSLTVSPLSSAALADVSQHPVSRVCSQILVHSPLNAALTDLPEQSVLIYSLSQSAVHYASLSELQRTSFAQEVQPQQGTPAAVRRTSV